MESGLTDNILTVCRTLNKFSVEYLIVGGAAVALHGYHRYSTNVAGEIAEKPDLDFWYKFRLFFNQREMVTLNDVEIPFINLILDKKANARSKDITDLEKLEINKKKNKG